MTGGGDASERERERVLGLCVRLTGDPDAAQDLAQETLFEAWRSRHTLRNPARRWEWLAGVARNVCRRWARRRGRDLPVRSRPLTGGGWEAGAGGSLGVDDLPDARFDVEVELERSELSVLLDRAMAFLPAPTRQILLARLVEDVPQREVAARLGVSEGVVAVRLQRGKVRMREVLTSHLAAEAAAFGLVGGGVDGNGNGGVDKNGEGNGGGGEGVSGNEAWRETRLWCPACGARRLLARFAPGRRGLFVRCPDAACGHVPADWTESGGGAADRGFFHGVQGFRPALTRVFKDAHAFHVQATASPASAARSLGSPAPLVVCSCGAPLRPRVDSVRLDLAADCDRCGSRRRSTVRDLLYALPPARELWRRHPRLRTLPPVEIERDGEAAVVLTLQRHGGGPRLDAVFARGTLALRALAGETAPTSGG